MNPSATDTGTSLIQESPGNEIQLRIAAGVTDPEHELIAKLAYTLWENRGCPIDSAEEDWIKAEQQLRERKVMAAAG
jgi:Protein of unknown function (DUF2934)